MGYETNFREFIIDLLIIVGKHKGFFSLMIMLNDNKFLKTAYKMNHLNIIIL